MVVHIIISIFVILIIGDVLHYNYKFSKFKKSLHVGSKLTITTQLIDDEFDTPHTFIITIIDINKTQAKVEYSDKSTSIIDIYRLFEEWTLIEE